MPDQPASAQMILEAIKASREHVDARFDQLDKRMDKLDDDGRKYELRIQATERDAANDREATKQARADWSAWRKDLEAERKREAEAAEKRFAQLETQASNLRSAIAVLCGLITFGAASIGIWQRVSLTPSSPPAAVSH